MRIGLWSIIYRSRRQCASPLLGLSWLGTPWIPTLDIGLGFGKVTIQKVGYR